MLLDLENKEELIAYKKFEKEFKDLINEKSLLYEFIFNYSIKEKDKSKIELDILNKIDNKKSIFYLKLAIANRMIKLTSYCLNSIKIKEKDFYILYDFVCEKINRYTIKDDEKEIFNKILFLLVEQSNVKIKVSHPRIKFLRNKFYKNRCYYHEKRKSIQELLLLCKAESNFKKVNEVIFKITKKMSFKSEVLKLIIKIKRDLEENSTILTREINQFLKDNKHIDLMKNMYFEGSFGYDEYLNLNKEEIFLVNKSSSILRINFIRKESWEYSFNKDFKGVYLKIKNNNFRLMDKYISELGFYYFSFDNYKSKENYYIKAEIDYLIYFFRNYKNKVSLNNLISFNILKKMNNIIKEISDYKKDSYFQKCMIELLSYFSYLHNTHENYSINKRILLIYKKLNSKKYPIPFSLINLEKKKEKEVLLKGFKKKYSCNIEDLLFNNYISKKGKEIDYLKSMFKMKEFQRSSFFKTLLYENLKITVKKQDYCSSDKLSLVNEDDKEFSRIFNNKEKALIIYEKYKYDLENLCESKLIFLMNYLYKIGYELDFFWRVFLIPNRSNILQEKLEMLSRKFEIYDIEKRIIKENLSVNFSYYEYKEFRESMFEGDWVREINNKKDILDQIIEGEKKSIKKLIYDNCIKDGLIILEKIYFYYFVKEIKDINYKKEILCILFDKFDTSYSEKFLFDVKLDLDELKDYGMEERDIVKLIKRYLNSELKDHNLTSFFNQLREITTLIGYFNRLDQEVLKDFPNYKFNRKKDKNLIDIHTKLFNINYYINSKKEVLHLPLNKFLVVDGVESLDRKYKIIVPKSSEELYFFSFKMNNCVKGYIDLINKNKVVIYNVLYENEPYINISIVNNKIYEIKKKMNKAVSNKEFQYFTEILKLANIIN